MKHQGQYRKEAVRATVTTVSGVFRKDCTEPAASDGFLGVEISSVIYWPSPMAGLRVVEDGHPCHQPMRTRPHKEAPLDGFPLGTTMSVAKH